MPIRRLLTTFTLFVFCHLSFSNFAASKAAVLYESALDAFVDGDEATFVKKMHQAGRANFAPALNDLGLMYHMGFKVEQDLNKALGFYQKSAKSGYRSAMFNLGLLHYQGKGTSQSDVKAKTWFTKAALLGDVDALYNLGVMNYVTQSDEALFQAYTWFAIAALLGSRRGLDARNRLSMDMPLERITQGDNEAKKFIETHEANIKNYQE